MTHRLLMIGAGLLLGLGLTVGLVHAGAMLTRAQGTVAEIGRLEAEARTTQGEVDRLTAEIRQLRRRVEETAQQRDAFAETRDAALVVAAACVRGRR